jgi:hypothetical protein
MSVSFCPGVTPGLPPGVAEEERRAMESVREAGAWSRAG